MGHFAEFFKGAWTFYPVLSKSEVYWHLYVPKREREREREREKGREIE
jgi:hypothetical protein